MSAAALAEAEIPYTLCRVAGVAARASPHHQSRLFGRLTL